MPAIAAYSLGDGAATTATTGFSAATVEGVFDLDFLMICARAAVYASPVFVMRARTRRLRSLLRGIVRSPLDAPRATPQPCAQVTQRTDDTDPGVFPPLPRTGLQLGQSLERLGADRRHPHDALVGLRRQGDRRKGVKPPLTPPL